MKMIRSNLHNLIGVLGFSLTEIKTNILLYFQNLGEIVSLDEISTCAGILMMLTIAGFNIKKTFVFRFF